MGKLLLIPTPIGNLGDITVRGKEALAEADCIYAEDTRTSRKLLNLLGIQGTLRSFHMHNEHDTVDQVIASIQSSQGHVALISDAGTPGISDPGFLLVRACIEAGIQVESLPGATAIIPALVGSGIPCDRFVFEGFLPVKKGRKKRIESWVGEMRTLAFYESPHRIAKSLKECAEAMCPDREACVAREISKLFETFHRGTLAELAEHFSQHKAKGEMVVVIAGARAKAKTSKSSSTQETRT